MKILRKVTAIFFIILFLMIFAFKISFAFTVIEDVTFGSIYIVENSADIWITQGKINGQAIEAPKCTSLDRENTNFNQIYGTILLAKILSLKARVDLYDDSIKIRGVVLY